MSTTIADKKRKAKHRHDKDRSAKRIKSHDASAGLLQHGMQGTAQPQNERRPEHAQSEARKTRETEASLPAVEISSEQKPKGQRKRWKNEKKTTRTTNEVKADAVPIDAELDEAGSPKASVKVSDGQATDSSKAKKASVRRPKATHGGKQKNRTQGVLALARKDGSGWHTSDSIGGRFLLTEPVFSNDEKYLFLATGREIHIYSTSTSLPARKIPVSCDSTISAFTISGANSDNIYLATDSGSIFLWNWKQGLHLQNWKTDTIIRHIVATASQDSTIDLVHTLEQDNKAENEVKHTITLRTLPVQKDAATSTPTVIFKSRKPCMALKVFLEGKLVITATKDSILIGEIGANARNENADDITTLWREVRTTEPVSCFDAQTLSRSPQPSVNALSKQRQRKFTSSSDVQPTVDLVIGSAKGALYVYEDIVGKLISNERLKNAPIPPVEIMPRILHWHREGVSSVKWSRDGRYIISGGNETVLVLWQLDTGKRQELPHLTTAIDFLEVSPSGASYAVQLADNSVMILSTTELQPIANIPGIQSLVQLPRDAAIGSLITAPPMENRSSEIMHSTRKTPAAVNPCQPNQLLLAVPATQPKGQINTPCPSPFVQTYDISANRHVSRQALTRNNATIVNISPHATKIREPDVCFLQVSHDGQWLATIEEWLPPASDLKYLASDEATAAGEKRLRAEIYMKFWMWDKEKGQWMLETRIDHPHLLPEGDLSGRIFDLVADPIRIGFTTIGEDGFARVWKPKTRFRDGTVVRGSNSEGLITWSCQHAIELDKCVEAVNSEQDIAVYSTPVNACLAYSADGSTLAATQEFQDTDGQGLVHFIDVVEGDLKYSKAGMYGEGLIALGVVGRHLVILCDTLDVWDLVKNELTYSFKLSQANVSVRQRLSSSHLSVDPGSGTFAVAFPFDKMEANTRPGAAWAPNKEHSKVIVFSPATSTPLYSCTLPHALVALIPCQGSSGYVALDAIAEVRVIGSRTAASLPLLAPTVEMEVGSIAGGIGSGARMDIDEELDTAQAFSNGASAPTTHQKDPGGAMVSTDIDTTVIRQQQLAEIFDVGQSHALPRVEDLYDAVVGLYARKPRLRVGPAVSASA